MPNIHKILYVSHAAEDESGGLMQAFAVARNHQAKIKVLMVCPAVPEGFEEFSQLCMDTMLERVKGEIEATRIRMDLPEDKTNLEIESDCGSRPAERVIRRVLREGYDLVIKNVEGRTQLKGFKAMDMDLLRKCPCPIWLCRSIKQPHTKIQVAVAIDPECEGGSSYDLAIRLLRWSRVLADSCSGVLYVISCWDFDIDGYLRHHFPLNASEEELDEATDAARAQHRSMLDVLIRASGIDGEIQVHHVVAHPDSFIPLLIDEENLDLLVMGTVGRAGIPGFIMGNTAENILQKVSCSLLALKPSDFVSPIKG
ncbi:universal stress protein [Microbulbifer sp. OS29]|uniref:Universal stress protein n=1 Tax=Microbulbifer okhotskensis TaxID=2926617 RepID=A0A9X2J4E3_9GAMM|nr:universal stress protein [Microbulbifer okhotskensis]MCO1334452.1 universal stress protein [Microbulbifer okhotskensis]